MTSSQPSANWPICAKLNLITSLSQATGFDVSWNKLLSSLYVATEEETDSFFSPFKSLNLVGFLISSASVILSISLLMLNNHWQGDFFFWLVKGSPMKKFTSVTWHDIQHIHVLFCPSGCEISERSSLDASVCALNCSQQSLKGDHRCGRVLSRQGGMYTKQKLHCFRGQQGQKRFLLCLLHFYLLVVATETLLSIHTQNTTAHIVRWLNESTCDQQYKNFALHNTFEKCMEQLQVSTEFNWCPAKGHIWMKKH